MKLLIAGDESEAKVSALIELTSIRSETSIGAIKKHLVQGFPQDMIFSVKQQNLNRDIAKLEEVIRLINIVNCEDGYSRNQKSDVNKG